MTRQDELPAALRGLQELPRAGGLVPDQASYCGYHGPQAGSYCPQCDEAHGINRAALMQADRVRSLVEELRALGFAVAETGPVPDSVPGPNETVMVEDRETRRAQLMKQLEELG